MSPTPPRPKDPLRLIARCEDCNYPLACWAPDSILTLYPHKCQGTYTHRVWVREVEVPA